ncbi:hypothetical protein J4558_17465 [Leptolyngbya sp. 15MV]|nr:hypothetical protein J4558_17465 [Leptolyngbya sp. 15MV]
MVGSSRSTPNGPRTARLRTFRAQSGVPPLPNEQFLNGWFFRQEDGVQQDVNALSITYSANVMNQGSHTQGCDKRGVFVTGSIGPVGGPTQTIVMSWAGTLGQHATFPGSPPLHWPRWAAVPPGSIQGAGRVSDSGFVVVSPAPPVWGQIESDTILLTIGSWTDTQNTTQWRLMRWMERPQP